MAKSNPFFLLWILLTNLSTWSQAARQAIGGGGGLMGGGETFEEFDPSMQFSTDTTIFSGVDQGWSIPPLDSKELIAKLGKENEDVARYIGGTLGNVPLSVKLRDKPVVAKNSAKSPVPVEIRSKFRAVVTVGSHMPTNSKMLSRSKKLRSVWSASTNLKGIKMARAQQDETFLLRNSYEESVSATCGNSLELEVLLPKNRSCKRGNPTIVYSFPYVPGTMTNKSRVCLSRGLVKVFPNGRKRDQSDTDEGIKVGLTSFHLHSGPSLVDWTWAKGKKVFWSGRTPGQV